MAAAGRLREYVTTKHVPGCEVWALTLTTHAVMSPERWRGCWRQLRNEANRAGVSLVYRVELQRRQTPHVHLVAWIPDGREGGRAATVSPGPWNVWWSEDCFKNPAMVVMEIFEERWLEIIGESHDLDARRHAVFAKRESDEGWACYLALHHGKDKRAQLGWVGKQWGVVGRARFVRRKPEVFCLTWAERAKFLRVLRRLLAQRDGRLAGLSVRAAVRRVKLPSSRKLMRCLPAGTVAPVLAWLCAARDVKARAV